MRFRLLSPRHILLWAVSAAVLCCAHAVAQRFAADIGRWAAQDEIDPPETGAVLFVGSSSIRRWGAVGV